MRKDGFVLQRVPQACPSQPWVMWLLTGALGQGQPLRCCLQGCLIDIGHRKHCLEC